MKAKATRKKNLNPSLRMKESLASAGLNITWPKDVRGEYVEGYFSTEQGYEKMVGIDFRDYISMKEEADVDRAIGKELLESYQRYDVDEELAVHMEGRRNGMSGVPSAKELIADLEDEEEKLEYFSDVAYAVYLDKPIPAPKGSDEDEITVNLKEVESILNEKGIQEKVVKEIIESMRAIHLG